MLSISRFLGEFTVSQKLILITALTLFLSIIVFSPAVKYDFINFDDDVLIYKNHDITVLNSKSVKTYFTTFYYKLYHPLTMLSFALDYKIDGYNPAVFHTTNILLHLINIVLVFLFIYSLFKNIPLTFFCGFIFAVHPMHVESVVWISERKDLLYSLFYMSAALFSVKYLDKKNNNIKEYKFYILSIIMFICSLLSKPMAVTFVAVVFLLDYFMTDSRGLRKKNISSFIKDKIPYIFLGIIFVIITVYAHYYSKTNMVVPYAFAKRIYFAFSDIGLCFYKFIYPSNLSLVHPRNTDLLNFWLMLSALVGFLITGFAVYALKINKKLFFGLAFFFITISPVLNIVPFGLGIFNERITYISYIGISISFYVIFKYLYDKITNVNIKKILIILLFLYLSSLVLVTVNRIPHWKNSITIFTDVINKYPEISLGYVNRGIVFAQNNDYENAKKDFNKALEINPKEGMAYNNLAAILIMEGRKEEAMPYLLKTIEYSGSLYQPYLNLAQIYIDLGRYEDVYSLVISAYSNIFKNVGFLLSFANDLALKGQEDLADKLINIALKENLNYTDYYNIASIYYTMKQYNLALENINKSKQLSANLAEINTLRDQILQNMH